MEVNFGEHQLKIEHLSKLGNLNELVDIGNTYRKIQGKKAMRMDVIIESVWFNEYLDFLNTTNTGIKNQAMKTKRGKFGGTWAHLKLMLRVAIQMDAQFADQVIETFITGKLLEHRDLAGENYKSLSASASVYPNVNYPQLAKALNWNVFNTHKKGIRQTATSKELNELRKLEEQMAFAIDMGYIKTFGQLIEDLRKKYHSKYDKF